MASFGMQPITMFDLTLDLLMELVNANATGQSRTYLDTWKRMSELGHDASGRDADWCSTFISTSCTDHGNTKLNTHMTMTFTQQTLILSTSAL